MFPKVTERTFERRFIHILDHSPKDSDYKLALARFLLDYTKDNTTSHVMFDTIAKYFLKCYWNQTKLRHSSRKMPDGKKEKVLELVKSMELWLGISYRPSFDQIERKAGRKQHIERCIKEIKSNCFHDVIPRFQAIGGQNDKKHEIFFKYKVRREINDAHRKKKRVKIDLDYGICLNPKAVTFFKDHHDMLSKFVTLEWARFLDKNNPGIPRLIEKTEGTIKRGSLKKHQRILEAHFPRYCFYCGASLVEQKYEVDHVIPFRYIAEDSLWNLALACKDCNCNKLGFLPRKQDLKNLEDRNLKYGSKIAELGASLRRLDPNFKQALRKYYENAQDNGYVVWGGPKANNNTGKTGRGKDHRTGKPKVTDNLKSKETHNRP